MTTTHKLDPNINEHHSNSKKLPSSQFKGVVPQPNGRWGSQIYQKHQRVWLGTFNLEPDAARAYDIAVQRFRGRNAVTNFRPLSEHDDSDAAELEFLDLHSKTEIVDMLRKHTYGEELLLQKRKKKRGSLFRKKSGAGGCLKEFAGTVGREHLFEKTVTPSDVGKLNRLVVPKQHAEKHFPMEGDGGSNGILLNFEDGGGKVWRFRYTYWNSSQSYVLTKGWSRFVKEKGLQAGDVVCFDRFFNGGDGRNERRLFIDCRQRVKRIHAVRLFGVDINSDADDGWINCDGNRSG